MPHPMNQQWHEVPLPDKDRPGEVHEPLWDHVRGIEQAQIEIHRHNLWYAELYAGRPLMTLRWQDHRLQHTGRSRKHVSPDNAVRTAVDTATAIIGKNQPRPTIGVREADFSLRRDAIKLDKIIYGEFKAANAWRMLRDMFRDAGVFGTGLLHPFIDLAAQRVRVERVIPDEIIVDEQECLGGNLVPRQMARRRLVHKDKLKSMFPGHEKAIDQAAGDREWLGARRPPADHVVFIEGWYLESERGAGDGRYAAVIQTATLAHTEFSKDRFPFVVYHWEPPLTGFYGQGIVELGLPYQVRLNELNHRIRMAQDIVSYPRFLVHHGSKVVNEHLDPAMGRVLRYQGQMPEVVQWQANSVELLQERERLWARLFEALGISALSSQASLPNSARLDSSLALQEFQLIENDRFAGQFLNYDAAHLELAQIMLDLMSDLKDMTPDEPLSTLWKSRDLAERVDWDQVDFTEDRYVVQLEAGSILDETPTRRMNTVLQMMQGGLLDQKTAMSLIRLPDIDGQMSLEAAAVENIDRTIERIREPDEQQPIPTPFQDLRTGIPRVHQAMLRDENERAPEEVLDRYQLWLAIAQQELEGLAQGAGTPGARAQSLAANLPADVQPQNQPPGGAGQPGGGGQPGGPAAGGQVPQ